MANIILVLLSVYAVWSAYMIQKLITLLNMMAWMIEEHLPD